ncbi:MAG TPA: tRNA (adenosine(37)-N6)-dimethylallyltransferase MiaA [Candidatus Paceibacterota bacterium]|jgi:tRNA dimethylallyltransferase|nr:tRNA (adenosine(37)-N6)-dimethylallyltransferase MiaA [Candidatus Paceibacterota bacterium]HJN63071.1 tRNA (adenosine(37)-N6)-dimethylallyltransferase MiaA [Candidatus Paceibacterota bacterium]|tara:strand:- start:42 stop:932 length:891 start_codon:yes stop_codon:yes gene_type:complete
MSKKILIILGPTTSGKSDLAVKIAKEFNGEIISADSRQVYKGLDIGTGKITKDEMENVPHYLLDAVRPSEKFDVIQFKKLAEEKVNEILEREKLPIVVGGTGFYIQSIVDGLVLPEVPPDEELRTKLEGKSAEELYKELQKLDPNRSLSIQSDNKRRLIRAVEIVKTLGKVPDLEKKPKYETLQIGLNLDDGELKERIKNRLLERMEKGMIEEVEKLNKEGLSFERMINLGLEYKYLAYFLKGEMDKKEMIEKLNIAIRQYAKRQKTWFKRDERIKWFRPEENKRIFELIQVFLNS